MSRLTEEEQRAEDELKEKIRREAEAESAMPLTEALTKVLLECYEHLNYCGWGDSWESEGAYFRLLPERTEAVLKRAGFLPEL